MKMPEKKKLLLYGGIALAALAAVILAAVLITSCVGRGQYDKYFENAQSCFLDGEYEDALAWAQKAMDADPTEACYLLMADIYMGMDDIDKAIETLYVGSYKHGSERISEKLEELKDKKAGLAAAEEANRVVVGGETISIDETALVLSQKSLTDADLLLIARLTGLTSLSLTENSISNITPLAGLTRLTSLTLSANAISDISALSGMTQLKTLYLDGNPITDFSPLYGLGELTTLSIKGISITAQRLEELQNALPSCSIYCDDVEEGVTEITLGGKTFPSNVAELDLGGLGLTDISGLEKCTYLTKLDLRDNNITDISPLRDLQELTWLCLWNNDIADIRPLLSLTKLTYLDVEDNAITDISILPALAEMEELWLSGNKLSNLTALQSLPALRRLGLKNIGLTDAGIDVLMGLTTLTELSIDDNEELTAEKVDELKGALSKCTISHSELFYTAKLGSLTFRSDAVSIDASGAGVTSLKGLEKFDKLTLLLLNTNKVTDLSPLSGLLQLDALELDNNGLSDLSPLSDHTSLRVLSLMRNSITDIRALSGCTKLAELHLSYNDKLSDISPLAKCTELTDLSLDNCAVTELTALSGCTKLRFLSLTNNAVSDLTPLHGLSALEALYIEGNSVTAEQVLALKAALPNCVISTDVDLAQPPAVP